MRNSKVHFNKKILVIGISSYIGNNIAEYLSQQSYEVIGSYNKNKPKVNSNYKIIKLDLTSLKSLRKIPKDIKVVINCACIKKEFYEDLKIILNNNILSSYLLINYINSELNIEKLIFTSSMSVFGYPNMKNITKKSSILKPTLYGSLKFLEEKIFISNSQNYSVFCLRLPGILDSKSKYSLIPKLYEDLSNNKLIKISNPYEKYNNKNYIKEAFPISAIKPMNLIDIVKLMKNYLKSSSRINIIKGNHIFRYITSTYMQNTFRFKTQTVKKTLNEYLINKLK